MVLHLIHAHIFHYQVVVDMVKLLFFQRREYFFVHAYKKRKVILVLGKCPRDGLDDTTKKEFQLSLHDNRSSSFLFYIRVKHFQFKARILKKFILFMFW